MINRAAQNKYVCAELGTGDLSSTQSPMLPMFTARYTGRHTHNNLS